MVQPTPRPAPATAPSGSKRIKMYGICFLIGLLLGLIPTGIGLVKTQRERIAVQQQLRVVNLKMNVATPAVMARHGDYTAARDAASKYFSDVRQDVDGDDPTLTAAQRSYLHRLSPTATR